MLAVRKRDILKYSPDPAGYFYEPYEEDWQKLVLFLQDLHDDSLISFYSLLSGCGLGLAMWCLCALPEEKENDIRVLGYKLALVTRKQGRWKRLPKLFLLAGKFSRGQDVRAELDNEWDGHSAAKIIYSNFKPGLLQNELYNLAHEWMRTKRSPGGSAADGKAKCYLICATVRSNINWEREKVFRNWLSSFDKAPSEYLIC
jgi:hypothetical protein